MALNDPLGDMIARIHNAQMRSKPKVSTPSSRLRMNVLEVLKSEGFIRGYAAVEHSNGHAELEIELKYFDGEPVIRLGFTLHDARDLTELAPHLDDERAGRSADRGHAERGKEIRKQPTNKEPDHDIRVL